MLEGCSEEVGVADGGRCKEGVPWVRGSWVGRAIEVRRVHVDVCVVLGGLGWAERCWVVPWVRGWSWDVTGACGGGVVRRVVFWGALVVSWRPVGGDGVCVWGAEQVSGPPGHARHGNG